MSTSGVAERGELEKALSVDQHGIEPIPERDRDSTSWQQFWIWFGANITPTSWVVGAIGPELGLSLVQSIVLMVVGQAAGALIFGFFTLMGKRTGVSQLALGRMAFGVRGNNIPSILQGLITLSWIGLNTYVVLSLATYCLHKLGLPNNHAVEYTVAAVIMIAQIAVGTLGFYAIRTFEKWTVPVLAVIMGVMTVLAFVKGHIAWGHSTVHGSALITSGTEFMTAVGIGWGFSWVAWASDYSRFTRPAVTERKLYWASAIGTYIPMIWLGILGAAMASSATNADPAELVASLFGVMTIPVLLVIIHGAVAVNIESVYSAPLCMLAGGIKLKRWVGSVVSGIIASGVLVAFLASTTFATSFTNYMNSFVIWTAAWGTIILLDYFVINRGRVDLEALYDDPRTSRYGDIRWAALASLLIGLVAGWVWEYGSASLFQGPLSRATNGVDFSWLAAILASGGAYWILARMRPGQVAAGAPVEDSPRAGIVRP
ncbi:MAG TPA: cytosine permease [Solirubrobacteraceae bacterium]|jgi:NCS1 family nucleobase:cation symporter-1|nr:cytosine permease [Solirubrobacteraceae bacterium]